MSASLLFIFVVIYFAILLVVAKITGRGANNMSFFIGNKNSHWMLVAFGMIGTSLSGVTFVSVPGAVGKDAFHYVQITLGYLIGYISIAYVLLPIYYKMNLTSIYHYLNERLGFNAYKTGASFFILSRTLGATARLYLVVKTLQLFILDNLGVPFWLTTLVILLMILLYTYEGGVKTIVYTDTLQTSGMLLGLVICSIYILKNLHLSIPNALDQMHQQNLSTIFDFDSNNKTFFLKQIFGGAFITLTMTGLDQEMMQKNISVKTLKDAQKNMITIGFTMLFVICLFLFLGGLIHLYSAAHQITAKGDDLFPTIALQYMPPYISIIFILALISALFPSADGAITALTSSFCIDILGIQRNNDTSDTQKTRTRHIVHLTFAIIFFIIVLVFKWIDNKSIIDLLLKIAAYTYGPLLGLFAFGIITKRKTKDHLVFIPCIIAPIICLIIDANQQTLFGNFRIGQELLIINGLLTFIGLWLISFRTLNK
jgi:SSS family transporter